MKVWSTLSLDAKVIGALALGNWLLLFANHTVVQVTRDAPLWQLFPGLWGAAWMLACGLLAAAYPLRDHRLGARFTARGRAFHFAAIIVVFAVIPTIAAIVLRETGKPFTYVHDGAIMVEEAARKLTNGLDPYSVDYLDTPLFYWPMINNPALYHFTYFPVLFLVTAPFTLLFDHFHLTFDERYLYLPAFIATLLVVAHMAKTISPRSGDVAAGAGDLATGRGPATGRNDMQEGGAGRGPGAKTPSPPAGASPGRGLIHSAGLALVAVVALNPQLYPFVIEGRNDFAVLLFVFAGIALLHRDRRTLGMLALSIGAAEKLHAGMLMPFALAYLWCADSALPIRRRLARLVRACWAGGLVLAVTLVPFLVWDFAGFWDDVIAYNAGGAAWSYPVSGMGFGALLRAVGVISYPQQDFPFAAYQLLAAIPIAAWALRRLRRDPSIATMLTGYSLTLLAFAFFGRYFHGNHLGFIVAVASPIPFLRPDLVRGLAWRIAWPRPVPVPVPGTAVIAPVTVHGEDEGTTAA